MTGKCSVCSHKDVDLINSLIISGATRQSRSAGDLKTILSGIGRIKDILEILLKVTGELENKTEINITNNSVLIEMQTVILKALKPYPEARQVCADALKDKEMG